MQRLSAASFFGRLLVLLLVPPVFTAPVIAQSFSNRNEPALILNATPQDREIFLSWSTLPEAAYTLRWRKAGETAWKTKPESLVRYAAVDSLDNGVRYQFQLRVRVGEREYVSSTATATPRVRDDCGYGASVFCTQQAFIAALPKFGLLPTSLRCDGEDVSLESVIPNCRFTAAGVTLGLDRAYGSVFVPNDSRPDAESVSQVVRRAIWGTGDFENIKREYAHRWAEVSIPFGGMVTEDSTVRSFVIRVAPGVFSRVTWYSRPDHVPGRYAIYHEGHGEAGISSAANVIDWLLTKGWQVLSLDMILDGINEEDRQYPLYDHDSFALYDTKETTGLRFFFIPLVSVMEMIETDARPGSTPTVMLLGRSGGGWSAYTYAAMDRRVDISVNIAGGAPFSTLLDSSAFGRITPHYENQADYLYDQASATDIMLAGGRRAAFFFYSQQDPCCYRFSPDSDWIQYLRRLGQATTGKRYRVFLGEAPVHGLTESGLEALGEFLEDVGLGPQKARPVTATQPTVDRN